MCWYEPGEENRREFKRLCSELVKFIRDREKIGDPSGISLEIAKELLDHLYNPSSCKEKPPLFEQ
jgi:hypothetical protein